MKINRVKTGLLAVVLVTVLGDVAVKAGETPYLRKQGNATQLIVEGKPFLMIAGELGNSSASSVEYMKLIWPKLAKCNLNTVLMPVYWDLIEPAEGKFDWTLVDGLIRDARRNDLRVVLLWFGSFKNSMSCYVPYWAKANYERFPRARNAEGRAQEMLSVFSDENLNADKRAFAALMRHIRKIDRDQTVIMVQVENEVGMIPNAREYGAAADEQFGKDVPKELIDYLVAHKETLIPEFNEVWKAGVFKKAGTWEDVFGKGLGTEEIFMAWHYARYTGQVAAAGKAEYALPMFVNAALIRPGYKPGQYPSGGPLPHLMDVWRAGAPQIDFLSPDVYFPNFVEWVTKYDRSGNPVFIPETGRGSENTANAFYAIGKCNAMGFSPFAIEGMTQADGELAKGYDVLRQLSPLILEHQGKGMMTGVLVDVNNASQQVILGDYKLNIRLDAGWGQAVTQGMMGGSIIISTGPDEYVIAGKRQVITFEPTAPGEPPLTAGIGWIQQGHFDKGKWLIDLWLNGDQSHQGRHLRLPGERYDILRIKMYRYR